MKRAIAATAAAALCVTPAVAQADVVFEKGSDIWVMEDDATDARVLVKASDLPDMDGGIADPHVDPTGKTVAFTGNTTQNSHTDYGYCYTYGGDYQYPCWTWHYGLNATGVYLLKDGQITRQSPAPVPCYGASYNCTMSDYSPELSAGATRHAYSFRHCQGTHSAGSYTCNSSVSIRGEGEGDFGTVCGQGDAVSFDPSINPKNANQIAYAGCSVGAGDEAREAVYVAEPGRANEHPVACDDETIADPSFSPAGDRLVTSQSGATPGLWVYDPSVNNCLPGSSGVHALVNPDLGNISFSSPRFMGPDKLVFAVGTKSGESWAYDLYTVPANCTGCAFPSGATRLTEGGESDTPAWTSAALAAVPPPPADPPPADTDGDGVPDTADKCPAQAAAGTADGCPAADPPPADTDGDGVPDTADKCPAQAAAGTADGCPVQRPDDDSDDDSDDDPGASEPPSLRALTVTPAAFRALPTGGSIARAPKGARVTYRLSEAASVEFKVARQVKAKRCRRRCVRWVGVGGFSHAGKRGRNGFGFTGRVAGRKLARGNYRLVAVAVDADGDHSKSARAPFRIAK